MAQLGLGAWSVYVLGLAELVSAILLLVPRLAWVGALGALAILSGAIVSHIAVLGISLGEADGGMMFAMGLVGWIASAAAFYVSKPARKG